MRFKKATVAALALALSIGSAMTSMAAWEKAGDGWKWAWSRGNYANNCWINRNNHWYYIGADEKMKTGWQYMDGKWYFMADSGEMISGLIKVDGIVYYMDGVKGHLYEGERMIRSEVYHFGENGTTNGSPYVYEEWSGNGTPKRAAPIRPR